jgi:FkbM family methyltransferase
METWIKQDYEPRITMGKIETVVDIGAHIGDFSVWACQRFQPAQVVAVEPTDDLYSLLKRNVALNHCQRVVKTVHAALFYRDTKIAIKKGASSATNSAVESLNGTTNAMTLEKLADENSLKSIDLLKIDIEGGEQHILTPANETFFRDRVKYLFMEAHDLQGNKKEDAGNYLRSLGYEVLETPFRWLFGIHRLQAWNPRLVKHL